MLLPPRQGKAGLFGVVLHCVPPQHVFILICGCPSVRACFARNRAPWDWPRLCSILTGRTQSQEQHAAQCCNLSSRCCEIVVAHPMSPGHFITPLLIWACSTGTFIEHPVCRHRCLYGLLRLGVTQNNPLYVQLLL